MPNVPLVNRRDPIPAGNPPPYDEVNPGNNPGMPPWAQQMMGVFQQTQQALANSLQDLVQRLDRPVGNAQAVPNVPAENIQPANINQQRRPRGNPAVAEEPNAGIPANPLQSPPRRRANAQPPGPNILPVNNPPPAAGNTRTQHLKTADAKIPQYSGASDPKTPYDFIIEMEKYKEVVGYTERDMLQYVIPLSLTQDAFTWYRYEPPFVSWEDFRRRLRTEFQAIGYLEDMRRELQLRTQGPTEPLTEFIRVIRGYYERIGDPVEEIEIVTRVLRNMHPEYKQALLGKRIATLVDLKREAHLAQELIKSMRTYTPPTQSGRLEPSLAWKPLSSNRDQSRETSSNMNIDTNKSSSKLHMSSVDPFAYHHPAVKKKVSFRDDSEKDTNVSNSPVRGRSPDRRPISPVEGNANQGTSSPRSMSPNRACYSCGNTGHFQRDCPRRSPSPNSGNGRAPSPSRR